MRKFSFGDKQNNIFFIMMIIFMIGAMLLPMFYKSTFGGGTAGPMQTGSASMNAIAKPFATVFTYPLQQMTGMFKSPEQIAREKADILYSKISNAYTQGNGNYDKIIELLQKIPGAEGHIASIRSMQKAVAEDKARDDKRRAEEQRKKQEKERLEQAERERINREYVRRESTWAQMGLRDNEK